MTKMRIGDVNNNHMKLFLRSPISGNHPNRGAGIMGHLDCKRVLVVNNCDLHHRKCVCEGGEESSHQLPLTPDEEKWLADIAIAVWK